MKRALLTYLNPLRPFGLTLWLALTVCVVASFFLFRGKPTDHIYTLRLSTGRIVTPPKRITNFFYDRAKDQGLEFALDDVDGSKDTLDKVNSGAIDLAVVKGGIRLGDRMNVRQVSALDIETFHLLVREKIFQEVVQDIGALREKRINVNRAPTGTYHWALDILKFAGLRPKDGQGKGNFTADTLGNPELLKHLDRIEAAQGPERERLLAELPDAVLLAEPVPSPIARRLVALARFRLVPLPFGPAYVQERHTAGPHEVLDSAALIDLVSIPAFSYEVTPVPVPAQPCPSIGVRRLLVANKNVSTEAISRCLHLLYDSPSDPALELLDWTKVRPQYLVHDGVLVYDFERKQVLQNTIVKLVERLASVLGGIIGLILAIYGYYRYRRLLRFEHYFHEIRNIDFIGRGKLADPNAPVKRGQLLAYLQNRLAELRTAAITEFAQGRLQGENLVLSIFTLIQDTNSYLTNLFAQGDPAHMGNGGSQQGPKNIDNLTTNP